jgi:ribosome-binding factor A
VNQRIRRVNEAVKEVLADRLADAKDPRIGFVTLTDVRMTTDLKAAEVFFTVLPDDEETRTTTLAGLESATPLLRRELGSRLRLRNTPELRFTLDPVPEQGRRIEELLRQESGRRPAGDDEAGEDGGGADDDGRR